MSKPDSFTLGSGFNYAAYKASLPPELQKYVPAWGPIAGVPIADVVEMLRELRERKG